MKFFITFPFYMESAEEREQTCPWCESPLPSGETCPHKGDVTEGEQLSTEVEIEATSADEAIQKMTEAIQKMVVA